jgi:hypothetical protein
MASMDTQVGMDYGSHNSTPAKTNVSPTFPELNLTVAQILEA